LLAARVPAGATLYLLRLKDEGIMFYYGRPVRRLASFEHLPSFGQPLYCILDESEWRKWQACRVAGAAAHGYGGRHNKDHSENLPSRSERVIVRLQDEQG